MTEKAAGAEIEPWLREILQPGVPRGAGRRRGRPGRSCSARTPSARSPTASTTASPSSWSTRHASRPDRHTPMAPFLDEHRIDSEESIAALDSAAPCGPHGRGTGPPGADPVAGRGHRAGRRGRAAAVGAGGLARRFGRRVRRARAAGRAGSPVPVSTRRNVPLPGWVGPLTSSSRCRSPDARRGRWRWPRRRRRGASLLTVGAPESPLADVCAAPAGCTSTSGRARRLPHAPVVDARPGDAGGGPPRAGGRDRDVLDAVADRLDEHAGGVPARLRGVRQPRQGARGRPRRGGAGDPRGRPPERCGGRARGLDARADGQGSGDLRRAAGRRLADRGVLRRPFTTAYGDLVASGSGHRSASAAAGSSGTSSPIPYLDPPPGRGSRCSCCGTPCRSR